MRLIVAFLILAGSLGLKAEDTPAVLKRMNAESASFRVLTANMKEATYTAVLSDTTEESGKVWMRRSERGFQMRADISQPNQRSIGLQDGTAQIFYPKMNTVQIYDLGKNKGLVDQFLVLGFGSSGKDLQANYTVRAAGEDVIGGQKTTRLELLPKSKTMKEQITKVELWIPLDAGHPVQQKFSQPGGDYYLITYSDIQLKPNLPESDFRLKLPADVKKEYPQRSGN